MAPEAGFIDATSRLRVATPPPGETPAERHQRLETLIDQRLQHCRERLSNLRIVVVDFEGYRPVGLDVELDSIAFSAKKGQEFSAIGPVAPLYPEKMRALTESEVAARLAEAESDLKWRLLNE